MRNFFLILIIVCFHIIPAKFQSCGQTQFSTGFIFNGEEVKRGEFPFLVALIKLKNQKFFCGANLITQKHALSASHCFLQKGFENSLKPEDIIAQLGRFNLNNHFEKGAINKEVIEIILHEDWKTYTTRYDADIALVVFDSEVQLSDYIKMICLPTSSQAIYLIEGQVVGYGASERTDIKTPEDTPRKVKIKKPPSNEFCFLHNPPLITIASNRTFCAGGENSGPCSGDSGGGLYVQRNSIWYLQGIVSSGLITEQRQCDVTAYAIYTNVALYVSWIEEKINNSSSIKDIFKTSTIINPKSSPKPVPSILEDLKAKPQSCGRAQKPKVVFGSNEEEKRAEFPFSVLLIQKIEQKYFCGANLITQEHALTASNCIQAKHRSFKYQPQDIVAKLGKHSLNNFEIGEVTKEISKIIMHEDWNHKSSSSDGDIAILRFDSNVQLSEYIQTICLPTNSDANNLIEGELISYGASKRTKFNEDTPRKITIKKPPSSEDCYRQDANFFQISSKRTFCAEGENDGPCFGDTGRGLFVKRNSVWYLQGIVSDLLINSNEQCDVTNYAIFTNVALYLSWIQQKIHEK